MNADANGWLPIASAPKDGTDALFYSPGNPKAGNENARDPYYRVDFIRSGRRRGWREYPEAPYTKWQPLPPVGEGS
jgi:hypothetical protein